MLDVEVIDIITEELIEFLETYIVMTSLTHESFKLIVEDQKSLKFGQYSEHKNWKGEHWFISRHSITKMGRTKLHFSFQFHKDEVDFLYKLNRLLDGYVDTNVSNYSDFYRYGFTFDVGSKANYIKLFDRLNFFNDEE
jgi:hypothetical protein